MVSGRIRVLVVDAFTEWRHFVCASLGEIPNVLIVGEAGDGPEAIEQATRFRPDLAVLDIGLPSLNGIEVARQIRRVSPESIIVFLTTDNSPDTIEECFRAGASGYVLKASGTPALLSAINAAIERKKV